MRELHPDNTMAGGGFKVLHINYEGINCSVMKREVEVHITR
jgi:hypothetical protein